LHVELKGSGRQVNSHTYQVKQFLCICKICSMPIFLMYPSFFMTFLTWSCDETIKYYLKQSINFSNLNFQWCLRSKQSRKYEFTEFIILSVHRQHNYIVHTIYSDYRFRSKF